MEELNCIGCRERKKSIVKGLLHHPSQSDCLVVSKYVSWTKRKYRRGLKIVYLHLAIGMYVFQLEKTPRKLLEEFSFGSGNR